MTWEILIPTMTRRSQMLAHVRSKLQAQIDAVASGSIRITVLSDDGQATIGAKRNRLLQESTADYVCFVDDDDDVADDYVLTVWNALKTSPDVVKMWGVMKWDGQNPRDFLHSLSYRSYFENGGKFFRPPNHLNCMRADVAKRFRFPEKNFGEDTDWAMQVCRARQLHTEGSIDHAIYFYNYRTDKSTDK
jgi:glycosyltransferase involved in cell wall biosynthesis